MYRRFRCKCFSQHSLDEPGEGTEAACKHTNTDTFEETEISNPDSRTSELLAVLAQLNHTHIVRETIILTFVAAEVVGAPRVGAQRGSGVIDGHEAVGAREERAEGVATLRHLARVGVTHRGLGGEDRNEAVGATDGSAQRHSIAGVVVPAVVTPCAKQNCRLGWGGLGQVCVKIIIIVLIG